MKDTQKQTLNMRTFQGPENRSTKKPEFSIDWADTVDPVNGAYCAKSLDDQTRLLKKYQKELKRKDSESKTRNLAVYMTSLQNQRNTFNLYARLMNENHRDKLFRSEKLVKVNQLYADAGLGEGQITPPE